MQETFEHKDVRKWSKGFSGRKRLEELCGSIWVFKDITDRKYSDNSADCLLRRFFFTPNKVRSFVKSMSFLDYLREAR